MNDSLIERMFTLFQNGCISRGLVSRAECKYFLLQMDRAAPEELTLNLIGRTNFIEIDPICLDVESRRMADASVRMRKYDLV